MRKVWDMRNRRGVAGGRVVMDRLDLCGKSLWRGLTIWSVSNDTELVGGSDLMSL